jgi:hypothetical protein
MRRFYKPTQAGFFLPMVLILSQIVMLYGISAALLTQLLLKGNGDSIRSSHQVNLVIQVASKLAADGAVEELPCQLPLMRMDEIRAQTANWWQRYGCRIENAGYLYYVVVESLGNDPCGLLSEIQQGYADTASYYQVTIADMTESGRANHLLMQATITVAQNQVYQCHASPHHVTAGLQMHRQL